MSFQPQTIDDNHEFAIALAKALLDEPDVSEGSFLWLYYKTLAGGVTANDAHLLNVENDLMPDTAEGDMQVRWGNIRGVAQKQATPARKSKALRVFGNPLANVAALLELTHASNLRFQITRADIVGPGGYVDVDVAAIDVGSATRLNAGETLTFVGGAPAGLQDDAELQLNLDEGGDDQEDPGAYRERILSRFKSPPRGGDQEDYVQWARLTTGIDTAYAYPLRQGFGSVDVAALHAGTGTDRVLIEPERAALELAINQLRPVSVRAFRVLVVSPVAVDVELELTSNGSAAAAFDWDDTTPPVVLAWTALTRTLQFTADRPISMQPGNRILFKNPTTVGNTGRERVIESLSGTDSVILEVDDAGDVPVATGHAYAGGPLVQKVRAAVIALFDSLGTANPDANPYGEWESNIDPGALDGSARNTLGVRRVSVITPVALVQPSDPAYPDDDAIELLVPGRLLVRSAH